MKLTDNFTLEELTHTHTGLPNSPDAITTSKLIELCKNVLQPAREAYGDTITVNSGYRSPQVNKECGGVQNSQHCTGEAADISCSDNAKLFAIIRDNITFDQLIWEGGNDRAPAWIHVSYAKKNRGTVLRMYKINGKSTYKTI